MKTKIFKIILPVVAIIVIGMFAYLSMSSQQAEAGLFRLLDSFANNEYKLPVNSSQIKFSFAGKIDKSSLTDANIYIKPEIKGKRKTDGDFLMFDLSDKLTKNSEYEIFLSKNIKNKDGQNLDKDYQFTISIVDSARVLFVNPSSGTLLQALHQNLAVFFSTPMVSLGSIDSKESLPCPVKFIPEVKGRCIWTTTSVLEFEPTDSFEGSTRYEVTISNIDDMNNKLESDYKFSFVTPALRSYISNFRPENGIQINFNFPVNPNELKSKMTIKQGSGNVDYQILNNDDTNTSFTIQPTKGKFQYSNNYVVNFGELKPQNGNINMPGFTKQLTSADFVNKPSVSKDLKGQTGTVIMTKDYYYESGIPSDDFYFTLDFATGVVLDYNNIKLVDSAGKTVNIKLEYVKEEVQDENNPLITNIVENKSKVKMTVLDNLTKNLKYKIIVSKTLNPYIPKDYSFEYKIAPELQILAFQNIDYNKSCVYMSNMLPEYWGVDFVDLPISHVSTVPESPIRGFTYQYKDNYNDCRGAIGYENGNMPKSLLGKKFFPYEIDHRMNPNTKYEVKIDKNLSDIYGNKLLEVGSFGVETKDISDNDKYLYFAGKEINAIPSEVPIVFNSQTINTTKINIEACEMNFEGYLKFLPSFSQGNIYYRNSYNKFDPSELCINYAKKNLKVKNMNRNLSDNKFDIEKDILGKKFGSKSETKKSQYSEFYESGQDSGSVVSGDMVDQSAADLKSDSDGSFVYMIGTKGGFYDYQNNYRGNSHQFDSLYIRTNLNIVLEKAGSKSILFVTDLNGNPINGVEWEFYKGVYRGNSLGYEKQKVKIGEKLNGLYEVEYNGDSYYNDIFVAKTYDQFGLLSMSNDETDNYDFGYIAGSSTSQKDYLYLYTERPIYKPGDTVYLKGLLRTFKPTGYDKSSIKKGKLKIFAGSDYDSIAEIDVTLDKNSNLDTSWKIPSDIKLGEYRFVFSYKGQDQYENEVYTTANIRVEEYVKPVFKINSSVDKSDVSLGNSVDFTISPEYYFGGKMSNTEGYYNVLSQKYFFDAKDYSDFQFGEGYEYYDCVYRGNCGYDDNMQVASDNKFKIGKNGIYNMKNKFPDAIEDGEKIYSFNFVVQDPDTSKTVKETKSIVVHNTDGYVGLDAPYWTDAKDSSKISLIVLDRNAQPKVGANAKLEIYKTEWKKVSKQGVDGNYYRDYYLDEQLIESKDLLTDNNGLGIYDFKAKTDGNYKLVAIYKGANGKEFKSSRSIFVSGDSYYSWNNDNNSTTQIIADKTRGLVGEKMGFTVQSPIDNGSMLILIIKDDDILDYKVQKIDSFAPRFEIPIKDTYYPNFYTKVYLIGTQDNNLLPVWKRGLAVTKVDTEYKKLKIGIFTDKQKYSPRQKIDLTIKVTDSKGNPVKNANLSIGIVDQSLLALMGNSKKNPYAYFYDLKRYLGTITYTSLKRLVDKLEVKDAQDGSKGGDGTTSKGGDSKKKRGIFKDTSRRLANGTTDTNGVLKITTDELPDNLTTREIEVLASSPDMKIGVNQAIIQTTKNVIINDNLPIWFGSDDEIVLSPVIFNKIGKNSKFEISITGTNVEFEQNKFETEIVDGESKTIEIRTKIKNVGLLSGSSSQSKIEISAKALDSDDEDIIYKFLPINSASIAETVSTFGKTTGSSLQETIDLKDILPNPGTLSINYGPTVFGGLLDGIGFVGTYPYSCLEQRLSAFMSHIYNQELFKSAGEKYDLTKIFVSKRVDNEVGYQDISVDQSIKDFLAVLSNFQNPDGGYVFRDLTKSSRSQNSDPRLTSYLVSSLTKLKKAGYKIPNEQVSSAISFLQKNFDANINCCRDDGNYNCQAQSTRISAINAILEYDITSDASAKMYNKLDLKCENNRYNKLGTLEIMAKLSKSKTTSSDMKKDLENKISEIWKNIIANELVFGPQGAYLGKTEYESKILTTAKFVEIVGILGHEKFADYDQIMTNIIKRLMIQKKDGHRGSTQENISVVRAISSLLSGTRELTDLDMTASVNLNSNEISSTKFDKSNKFETVSQSLLLNNLQTTNTFTAKKTGKGNLYYDLQLKYYIPTENIRARDMGFDLEVSYYDYNQYKNIQTLKSQEREKYNKGEISYNNLEYNKPIVSYLSEISGFTVGQIVLVHNKIVTNESRDQVAFDGYFPAGAMIINPNLATEEVKPLESNNQQTSYNNGYQYGNNDYDTEYYRTAKTQNIDFFGNQKLFDYTEYRSDKFFGYADNMNPGIYQFDYMIRITHAGVQNIKPSQAFEFYQPETFGYGNGRKVEIGK